MSPFNLADLFSPRIWSSFTIRASIFHPFLCINFALHYLHTLLSGKRQTSKNNCGPSHFFGHQVIHAIERPSEMEKTPKSYRSGMGRIIPLRLFGLEYFICNIFTYPWFPNRTGFLIYCLLGNRLDHIRTRGSSTQSFL